MKIQQFLEHHGVIRNPFAEEDAKTDPVFKDYCIATTYHPTWDKVYGDPAEPSTSIVFGEKGSGKTAMRLQIAQHLGQHNRKHPVRKVYVIEYDDFNHYLDRFRDKLPRRHQRPDKTLKQWKLWDHMDAVLASGVTGLVDRILGVKQPANASACAIEDDAVDNLDRHQARDLLLLAACYDESTAETFKGRWTRLRNKLGFHSWKAGGDFALGIGATVIALALGIFLVASQAWLVTSTLWLVIPLLLAGWGHWLLRCWKCFRLARGVVKHLKVGNRETNPLRSVLMRFTVAELSGQPLPNKDRTDDRYELLLKFQGILRSLGFTGIVVIVDRVDEPHMINGSAELMRELIWPMLDNKFLKHPGLGLKLMLPIELHHYVDRENKAFYERARLDKQNMVPSLAWTGEALFDVANARMKACAGEGKEPALRTFFADSVTDARLVDAMRSLRVPRHLFKFLYHLFVSHCNTHTDANPVWQISSETFESNLAVYLREQEAFDRGLAAG